MALPAPDRRPADASLPGDLLNGKTLGREKDDLSPLRVLQETVAIADKRSLSSRLTITLTVYAMVPISPILAAL